MELKDQVEQIATTFTALRSDVDGLKSKQADALDEVKFNSMVKKITDDMEALRTKHAALEAASLRQYLPAETKDVGKTEFENFVRKGIDLKGAQHRGPLELEVRAMQTTNNPDGGYLVRPQFANFVIDRIFETSPVRRLATVVQMSSKSLTIDIDDNEADAAWGSENAFTAETNTPQVGQKEMVAFVLQAFPKITNEMIEDAYFDVESWLQNKLVEKFGRMENTAFVSGDGVSRPRGFTTYAAWATAGVYERNKIEQINSTAAANVAVAGLIGTQNSLKEGYQAGAAWGMKRTTFGEVLKLKSTDIYHFLGLSVAPGNQNVTMQILQKPVTFMDDMAAVGAGNLSVVYADWKKSYTIADRVGLQILRDPYTSPGRIKYITRKRVGGDVTSFDAIKLMKCSA